MNRKNSVPFAGFVIAGSLLIPFHLCQASDLYVDSAKGSDQNPGTQTQPLQTIPAILKVVRPGDTVNLKGVFLGYNELRAVKGTVEKPIVFQGSGEPAVFDGGLPFFRDLAKPQWERVPKDENPAPDEWRSTVEIPRGVYRGQFLDTKLRLLTYSVWEDFRSPNETWDKITDPADPRPGPEVVNGKGESAKYRFPWTYYGPGILYNDTTKRLHIRLSHTHHGVKGHGAAEYEGETDPNKLRLSVTEYATSTFTLASCQNLIFRNIDIQNGGNWMGSVTNCDGIEFNHVRFYPATYPLRIGPDSKHIRLLNCLHDGGVPPWSFRSEFKDVYKYKLPNGDIYENNQVRKTNRTLLAFEATDSEIAYNEFRHGHDLYLSGTHDKFHNNLIEDIHDDSLFVSARNEADFDVYENYFRRCLTVWSFASPIPGGTRRAFYRNVIDVREPVVSYRPSAKPGGLDPFRSGSIFKVNDPIGPYTVYQNTFLTKAQDMRDAFTLFGNKDPDHKRYAFNNIFVSFNPAIDLTFLERPDQPVQTDGNLWFRTGESKVPLFRCFPSGDIKRPALFNDLKEYKASPFFELSKAQYAPGFEASSIVADPKFMSMGTEVKEDDDFRLSADSPGRGAGVELPADWPDPMRPKQGKPDMGALPYDSQPLRVGMDARYSFPAPKK